MKVVSYVSYELWYIYYTSVYQIPTEPGQIYFVSAWWSGTVILFYGGFKRLWLVINSDARI